MPSTHHASAMHVSVIMPVFNSGRYLAASVESCLAQPEVRELLLVNDGSTDDSRDQCAAWVQRHPDRIRLLEHPGRANRGPAATRNLGLEHAKCEWVAFLDADDIYLRDRFRAPARLVGLHPDLDGVYCQVAFADDTLVEQLLDADAETQRALLADARLDCTRHTIDPDDLFDYTIEGSIHQFYTHTNGIVFRKSALARCGLLDERLRTAEDREWFTRLAATSRLQGSGCLAAAYRQHGQGVFQVKSESEWRRDHALGMRYLYEWACRHYHHADRSHVLMRMQKNWVGALNDLTACPLRLSQRLHVLGQLGSICRIAPRWVLTRRFAGTLMRALFSWAFRPGRKRPGATGRK